ncbi:MAG: hypothetical protein QXU18_10690 [Thermoplasmatales archaeon]
MKMDRDFSNNKESENSSIDYSIKCDKLGWKPKTKFIELVHLKDERDIARLWEILIGSLIMNII